MESFVSISCRPIVSISLPDRCPTWAEMSFIHGRFFKGDEEAMQLVPSADHINNHPYTLHLGVGDRGCAASHCHMV
jgi:hypothetical protein